MFFPRLLLVCLSGSLASFAFAGQEAPALDRGAPTIAVTSALQEMISETLLVSGTLLPREEVISSAEIDGIKIVELLAEQGDLVKKDQILARLQTDLIDLQVAQNAAARRRSEATIAQAQSGIKSAEAAAVEAGQSLQRAMSLRGSSAMSQATYEQRKSASDIASAQLTAAKDALKVAQADLEVILAQGREIILRRDRATIKAPVDGLILARYARLGAIVATGSGPLFLLARDGLIEFEAEVPEVYVSALHKGQMVLVTPGGESESVSGTVRLINPQLDPVTRLAHLRVALPQSSLLYSGRFARGKMTLVQRQGIVVPLSAVVRKKEGQLVQLVQKGRITTRKVTTGIVEGDRIEILAGIEIGDRIVLKSASLLRDGDVITPVDAQGAPIP